MHVEPAPTDWEYESRVEVFRNEQTLFLKPQDVAVARLSRVFKLQPDTIFLEEDVTRNAEFPHDGKFQLSTSGKYKVCCEEARDEGMSASLENQAPQPAPPAPQYLSGSLPGPSRGWTIPRPWASDGRIFSSSKGKNKLPQQTYEPFLKRSFPMVNLALDSLGKNIVLDSTTSNVYIRVAESSVSVPTILAEVGRKVSIDPAELVILDSKFLPVSDDKDLEYWKSPARRLYVAKQEDYGELVQEKMRKRSGHRQNRKRTLEEMYMAEDASAEGSIQSLVQDVSSIKSTLGTMESQLKNITRGRPEQQLDGREVIPYVECKICKAIPSSPVLLACCRQILGCADCLERSLLANGSCPLCRASTPNSIVMLGYDSLCTYLKEKLETDED